MHFIEKHSVTRNPKPQTRQTDKGAEVNCGSRPVCRFCHTPLKHQFVDLGMQPLCESYITHQQLNAMEPFYPIKAFVCEACFLVQIPALVSGEAIYSHYAYFSSYSDSWLRHCKKYTDTVIERFKLHEKSQVIEVASNDGYLLQFFIQKGIPVQGIEPAANIAEVALKNGIPTMTRFFGTKAAKELVDNGRRADLLVGNNVLAHVPDLNDFVTGLRMLLGPAGVLSMEFSHLMRLIQGNQFDQIYQEHYSYFSFIAVKQIFAAHGLTIFDAEELSTHGGSLRIYACRAEDKSKPVLPAVADLEAREIKAGYRQPATYRQFSRQVAETKYKLLEFLIQAKREGKHIVGYGAPGKGTTLLNYCRIGNDFIDYTVDRNPFKQGKFLPGVHIPIYAPEKIATTRPDYILLLPWNLKDELIEQLDYVRRWGAKFVVPIPEVTVYP